MGPDRWCRAALLALTLPTLLLAACAPSSTPTATPTPRASPESLPRRVLTPAPSVPGNPTTGRQLFVSAGCAGCHTLNNLPGATGVAGPNLTNIVLRPTLAGETIPLTPDTLTRFLLDPSAVKPGSSMPSVGLTEPEARDIAAFLYSQPHNP